MPRATRLGSRDDLGVALSCSSVPLLLGDGLNACFPWCDVTSDLGCAKASGERDAWASHYSKVAISRSALELAGRATQPAFIQGILLTRRQAAQILELYISKFQLTPKCD